MWVLPDNYAWNGVDMFCGVCYISVHEYLKVIQIISARSSCATAHFIQVAPPTGTAILKTFTAAEFPY